MRLHEIITEKAIPNSFYGYWVTDRGDILPVPYESHAVVARQHGFEDDREARYNGWVQVTYKGYGPFYAGIDYMGSRAAASVRELAKMAEDSGCTKFLIGSRELRTYAEVARSLTSKVRAENLVRKERIAQGLPPKRSFRDEDDDLNEDVMIDEIEMLPDQSANLADFQPHFTEEPIWIDPNNDQITIRRHDGRTQLELGVFRGDELIALVVTEPFYIDSSIDQIKLTAVAPGERQKGFMRLLIGFYRDHIGQLCSDQAQSADAKAMWKALIQQPMGLRILVWDTTTGDVRPAKGVPENEIWNDAADVVLLVEDIDLHRYGNRHDANLLIEKARYVTQRRWDGPLHPLFP